MKKDIESIIAEFKFRKEALLAGIIISSILGGFFVYTGFMDDGLLFFKILSIGLFIGIISALFAFKLKQFRWVVGPVLLISLVTPFIIAFIINQHILSILCIPWVVMVPVCIYVYISVEQYHHAINGLTRAGYEIILPKYLPIKKVEKEYLCSKNKKDGSFVFEVFYLHCIAGKIKKFIYIQETFGSTKAESFRNEGRIFSNNIQGEKIEYCLIDEKEIIKPGRIRSTKAGDMKARWENRGVNYEIRSYGIDQLSIIKVISSMIPAELA
jgi:hypothetical protein